MAFQLTAGSCMRLHNASPPDEDIFNSPHTIQFLSIKNIYRNTTNQSPVYRYRIIMSDGINFIQVMLATQLNHMVREDVIGKHTVAVIETMTCNYVQGTRLIIVIALRVLGTPEGKIGEPVQLVNSINVAADPAANAARPPNAPARAVASTSNGTTAQPQQLPTISISRGVDRFSGEALISRLSGTSGGNQLQRRESGEGNGAVRSLEPRMDLHENTEKNLVTVTFELPGLKKEDVNINVHSNRLEISAESKLSSEHEENGYAVRERQFGKLARTIQLPPEEIKASMEDGVLTVTFPKTAPELAPKKILIA